jgi:hypothetical protein
MKAKKSPKVRFNHTPLYRRREPHAMKFLLERGSFWFASFSVMAFMVGNMVGQHGWYVFWRSVWGEGSEQYIAYTGVVTPIDKVPDYTRWYRSYGGDPHTHTFDQVPRDLLVSLPSYSASGQRDHEENSEIGQIYSVGHNGSYTTGGDNDGSHPGVDIRVPIGTPVRSIAAGVVSEVKDDTGGFGIVVVIKHPNMPDPSNSRRSVTLYSAYAHLSAALVEEGMIVQKGERLALSGDTGFASGPHLHFQIDNDDAPWHPYWPFSTADIRAAGLKGTAAAVNAGLGADRVALYTVHPMLYVQNTAGVRTLVASSDEPKTSVTPPRTAVSQAYRPAAPSLQTRVSRLQGRLTDRVAQRLSRQRFATAARGGTVGTSVLGDSQNVVVTKQETVSAELFTPATTTAGVVQSATLSHDGSYNGRGWETVTVTILGGDGKTVTQPLWEKDLYLRTAYGDAEFRPTVLKAADFTNGKATVQVLPRGRRTLVIQLQPLGSISKPMEYKE